MSELRKENNRLFGRLLNIYEVSKGLAAHPGLSFQKKIPTVRDHRPGSLAMTKNKLESAKINKMNMTLGAKLVQTGSEVPD